MFLKLETFLRCNLQIAQFKCPARRSVTTVRACVLGHAVFCGGYGSSAGVVAGHCGLHLGDGEHGGPEAGASPLLARAKVETQFSLGLHILPACFNQLPLSQLAKEGFLPGDPGMTGLTSVYEPSSSLWAVCTHSRGGRTGAAKPGPRGL